ncbi:MAG: hypothetical protein RLZZ546_1551 [Bacteroidota bacterium]|jgi:hypothetical protein
MAWKYHDGMSQLKVKVGSKVKTQLTPFKCALGETVEDDDEVLYKKSWTVEEVTASSLILKSGAERMETTLSGFSLGEWIHHRIYKVKE